MFAGPATLKSRFKETFNIENGTSTTNSIRYFLSHIECKKNKTLLNDLIRPQYLQEYFNLMHDIID